MTDEQHSRFERLKHVYRTRARTTTVVLVVLWFVLLGFYNFSSQHYPSEEAAKPARTSEQSTNTPEPRSTTSETTSTAPSRSSAPEIPESSDQTERTGEDGASSGRTGTSSPLEPPRRAPLETHPTTEPIAPTDTTPDSDDDR